MSQSLRRGLFGFRGAGVKESLAERDRTITQLSEEATAAQTRATDLESVLEATRKELGTARSDLEELERKVKAADERSAGLEAELGQTKAEGLEHADRARRAGLEATSLQMEIAAVQRDLLDRETRIRQLEDELAAARSAQPMSGFPIIAENASVAELGRALEETERAITHLLADARSASERELAESERRRAELRAEIDRLTAWRDGVAPLAQEVRSLIGEAQQRTAELDERLRAVLDPMTFTIGSLRGRLDELMERAIEGSAIAQIDHEAAETEPPEEVGHEAVDVESRERDDHHTLDIGSREEIEHPTPW